MDLEINLKKLVDGLVDSKSEKNRSYKTKICLKKIKPQFSQHLLTINFPTIKVSLLIYKKGGPTLYIKQVFDDEKENFTLKAGPEIEVEILITKRGEFGKILAVPK